MRPFVPLCLLAAAGLASPARAGVVYSVEAPGVQGTTVAGVVTHNFNSHAPGLYANLSTAVGTFSAVNPGFAVVAPDQFGGSNQTRYLAAGNQSQGQGTVTWALPGPQDYAGVYWSAVDWQNKLDVYSGSTLLLSLTRADFNAALAAAYFGNPNTGENTGEPYVYFNFFGTAGTTFDRLVFTNMQPGTGFESDNHSLRSSRATQAAVPEPVSAAVFGALAGAAGLARRRKRVGR